MKKTFKNVAEVVKNLSNDKDFVKEVLNHFENKSIGKFLMLLRCKYKLTQEEVADELGWSLPEVERIESASDGDLTLRDIHDYAKVFDIKINILLLKKKEDNEG